jgi:hypothetical protein
VRFSTKQALHLTVIVGILSGICAGQSATVKPPEPDAIGVFFYLDPATQMLKRLPNEEFRRHSGGFASVTTSIKVSREASSFQIQSNPNATFVFKVFKEEAAAGAKLFHFDVKGSEREYELGKWKRRDYTPNPGLPVNVSKFGDSSFKLSSETPLEPGEYALTLGPTVFTFSVR